MVPSLVTATPVGYSKLSGPEPSGAPTFDPRQFRNHPNPGKGAVGRERLDTTRELVRDDDCICVCRHGEGTGKLTGAHSIGTDRLRPRGIEGSSVAF